MIRTELVALFVLLLSMIWPAAGAEKYVPPKLLEASGDLKACSVQPPRDDLLPLELTLELSVGIDGRARDASWRKDAPRWAQGLSGCLAEKLRIQPAAVDNELVEVRASLHVQLESDHGNSSGAAGIGKIGPLVTWPSRRTSPRGTDDCFPRSTPRLPRAAQFVVQLTVQPDGSISEVTLSDGSEPWQEAAARCVLEQLTFRPGSRDGVLVSTRISQPISATAGSGRISTPKLRSTVPEIEAAYRACYPPDMISVGSAHYLFDLATDGKVSNPEVIKSSGDARLDEVGACILAHLKFRPTKLGGRAMPGRATWELQVRPPR